MAPREQNIQDSPETLPLPGPGQFDTKLPVDLNIFGCQIFYCHIYFWSKKVSIEKTHVLLKILCLDYWLYYHSLFAYLFQLKCLFFFCKKYDIIESILVLHKM